MGISTGNNSLYYTYALNHTTTPGYILSTRSNLNNLVDLPSGYSTSDAIQIPFYIPTYAGYTTKVDNKYVVFPMLILLNTVNNTTDTTTSLAGLIPEKTKILKLLIEHNHIGTVLAGISIYPSEYPTTTQTILSTNVASNISLSLNIPVGPSLSITTKLTAVASTTSYTVKLQGFYVGV